MIFINVAMIMVGSFYVKVYVSKNIF